MTTATQLTDFLAEVEPASDIRRFTSPALTKPLPVFSHAVVHSDTVYVSCLQGFEPGTFEFPEGGAAAQAETIMRNLRIVLEQAGSDMDRILKMTLYFTHMQRDFEGVNAVVNRHIPVHGPARSSIGVAELPRGALIVMDFCAAVKREPLGYIPIESSPALSHTLSNGSGAWGVHVL